MTHRLPPGEALVLAKRAAEERRNRSNQQIARAFVKGTELTAAEHLAVQRRLKAEFLERQARRAA